MWPAGCNTVQQRRSNSSSGGSDRDEVHTEASQHYWRLTQAQGCVKIASFGAQKEEVDQATAAWQSLLSYSTSTLHHHSTCTASSGMAARNAAMLASTGPRSVGQPLIIPMSASRAYARTPLSACAAYLHTYCHQKQQEQGKKTASLMENWQRMCLTGQAVNTTNMSVLTCMWQALSASQAGDGKLEALSTHGHR